MRQVYLDNAATSFPKPECVYRAMDTFMRECGGSPGRASHRKARDADDVVLATRKALARLFGVPDHTRIVLTCNATESLNLAIKGIVRHGDHVVLTDLEHNAVARPLWRLRETLGVRVSVVDSTATGFVEPCRVADAIGDATRLVCCTYASNVLGTIQPVADIAEVAHWRRVPLLVDASQTAGIVPIDVQDMGIDLLAFTGHKALLGPPGTGGLYIRDGIALEALKHGGTGIASESLHEPHSVPEGYEAGTANSFGIAGLAAGIDFVSDRGVETIRAHEVFLNELLMESLRSLPGVVIYGPDSAERKVGITTFNLDGLDPADVGRILDQRFGVMVRTGLHCAALAHRKLRTERRGGVRVSFGYFNTVDDVGVITKALQQISAKIYQEV